MILWHNRPNPTFAPELGFDPDGGPMEIFGACTPRPILSQKCVTMRRFSAQVL
jgi:hypothetical protein